MARLPEALVKALIAGQWSNASDRRMALEIARRESQFDATAHNTAGRDNSYGLFQINMKDDLGTRRRQRYQLPANEVLFDPSVNVAVARRVWEDNGQSFGGSAGWSTSASAAAAITGGDDDGDDEQTSPMTAEDQAVWNAMTDEERNFYENLPLNSNPIPRAPGVTDREHIAGSHYLQSIALALGHVSTIEELTPIPTNPLEWGQALSKVLSKLLDPTFWKRIGIGVLAFLIVAVAVVFYNKDAIATVASKGTVNDV